MYMYIFRPRALISVQVLYITESVSVFCILRAYGLLCTLNGLPWAGVWGGPAPTSYKYVLQTLMIIHSSILASNMVSSLSFLPSLPPSLCYSSRRPVLTIRRRSSPSAPAPTPPRRPPPSSVLAQSAPRALEVHPVWSSKTRAHPEHHSLPLRVGPDPA
jgi:hypothetical protein